MAKVDRPSEQAAALRRRAEALALVKGAPSQADIAAHTPAELSGMFHELLVHQIELEMQNEEIRTAHLLLDESRARYFDLYDLAPLGYLTLSESGLILEANLYAASRLDVSRMGLVHQPFTRFIHKDDQDAFYLHRKHLLVTGSSEGWELRMVGQDGGVFWAHLDATAALEVDGTTVIRLVMGDITERKRVEEQLQNAEKMQSLGILAGGIAHDMNNVLGAILGLASANLQTQAADSPAHRAFATITKAAERGGTMVRSLLSLARQRPATAEDLDLDLILLDEIRLLERTTLNRIQVELDLGGNLHLIHGDAAALSHAFMNLFVNSADAMPGGGTLTIRTRNLAPNQVEVLVEDTGTGMPADVLKKAMDPFFTTKDVGKGTGLGLSILYATVTAHHGQIDLESEPGLGTRVRLRFPAIGRTNQSSEREELQSTSPSTASLRVLVVDDDDLMQASIQSILTTLGHDAIPASGGEEGLAWLDQEGAVDLVILDMNMPGLDGAGTLARLRALRPTLPVLLVTGRADQAVLELANAYPHVLLLPKPFTFHELQQHLERVIRS